MSDPYLGEIRMFAGNFAPVGWALCDGRVLSISSNTALFALLGTVYGGDGQVNFALPDLRGRVPVEQGSGPALTPRPIGQRSGSETVTLTLNQIPQHNHAFLCSTAAGSQPGPANGMAATPTASSGSPSLYIVPGDVETVISPMAATAVLSAGNNQPHENMMPSLCINFIIALQGAFPSRN